MFLVSMADIIGSYERLPNDAVRAVAFAKRRECLPIGCLWIDYNLAGLATTSMKLLC